jgi:pimeloyl-ACP methyl ester carboxylesterase
VQVISYPNTGFLTYEALIKYVIARAPERRFVVLGESFSGPIAIEIAATHARVAGLVLASSFARHPLPSLLGPLARRLDLRWVPTRLIEAMLLGGAGSADLKESLAREISKLPREVLRGRASEALNVDKRQHLRNVTCPVLCLHGRFDRLIGKRHCDEIRAIKPSCEVRMFDAPHMLLETRPVEAAAAIVRFCEQLN